jgi:imidazolonepropionase-like amidohydrolase
MASIMPESGIFSCPSLRSRLASAFELRRSGFVLSSVAVHCIAREPVRRLLKILVSTLLLFLVLLAGTIYLVAFRPLHNPHPAAFMAHGILAIQNARIYISPDTPLIEQGTIVIRDGRIAAVGPDVAVPEGARVLPCDHCVVTAGFWNAHIHFTESKWLGSAWKSGAVLNTQLADMLTSHGFTTVVDTGSDLRVTVPIRKRIESGELFGPKIYTAGAAQYPPNGTPFYLKDTLPLYILKLLPQPATPAEAARIEERNILQGADILKLFTGSLISHTAVLPMPVENARAAVEVAHRQGQLAFSHPSNLAGVQVAIESGVDVLAHAPSEPAGVDTTVLQALVDKHMAMIPTLKMFGTTVTKNPAFLDPIYAEVRLFHAVGGQLIFGTDVGYMTDYTTEDEFTALRQSGLNAQDILRMLTTAPAERFGVGDQKGTIAPGKLADLVVLSSDPAIDVSNFAKVQTTVRSGRVIYSR